MLALHVFSQEESSRCACTNASRTTAQCASVAQDHSTGNGGTISPERDESGSQGDKGAGERGPGADEGARSGADGWCGDSGKERPSLSHSALDDACAGAARM